MEKFIAGDIVRVRQKRGESEYPSDRSKEIGTIGIVHYARCGSYSLNYLVFDGEEFGCSPINVIGLGCSGSWYEENELELVKSILDIFNEIEI